MGIFSTTKPEKELRPSHRHWDEQLYKRLIDDTDQTTAILIWQSFRNALRVSLKEWQSAVERGDLAQIRQIAHKTRSSSMLLGFKDFALLSQNIEQDIVAQVDSTEMQADFQSWMAQAEATLLTLDTEPQGSLGQEPITFTKNGVDADR